MASTIARAHRRIAVAGLVLPLMLAGCGGHGGGRMTAPPTPKVTTLDRTVQQAPSDRPPTLSSPAFADGASIPVQYTCKGADVAPPLTWWTPEGGALLVDDPDAARGPYVHWIVMGMAPGSGSTADGQTPVGGSSLPNSAGQAGYSGPCPPAGSGTHHYRFTLYQLPATFRLASGSPPQQAAEEIARAAAAQAQFIGTFAA